MIVKEYSCTTCGQKHSVEVFGRINVEESPDLKAAVKDGSLFVWECPHCGTRNLASYQTIYHDPEARALIWLLPEGSISQAGQEALEAQLDAASEALEGYVLRRVGDVGSLVEKVNILDAGLDDMAIEMCKYVTKMELMEKGGGQEIKAAPFKFYRIDGPDNDIEFSYPSEGRMHGLRIGFNVYEDCAGILRRNPSMKPLKGFASIDQSWVARYFA